MRHAARRQARHGRAPPARRGDGTGRGRPVQRQPLVRVGPLPLRAGVGHGARGLQRRRRRVGLVPARPRPVARLPVERGRDGRALRHPPRALPRRCRCGTGATRSSRSGCSASPGPQGNHGEDAKEYWWYLDGLPSHAWLRWRYHYPQAAFPYQRAHRGERPPGPGGARVRAARHRRVRGRPVLGGGGHLREGSPTEVLPASPWRTAARTRRRIDVLPTLWFRNTWRWDADAACRSSAGRRRGRGRGTTGWPGTGSRPRRDRTDCCPRRCSATTRRTPLACTARRSAHAVPEGRHQRPRRRRGRPRSTRSAAAPRRPGGTT